MPSKHENQHQMMQRMYGGPGGPGDRGAISPPGLLSGRHPAGAERSAVPFSMGMNIRPVAGGPASGHPLSPDAVRDTVGVRDTGTAAAAEAQAQMQQQALAQQEQQVGAR
jgi:hypothetical protein